MRAYSNMTTKRLEQEARKEGVDCQIRVFEAQEDGRYFVVSMDETPLKQPVSLGFTDDQAIFALRSHRWERYVLRDTPTRLGSAARKAGRPRRYIGGW